MTGTVQFSRMGREAALFLSLLVVVVVALPLLALAGLAGRLLIVAAIPAAVIAAFAIPLLHRRLARDRAGAEATGATGLRPPSGVWLHPRHSWARPAGDDRVTVGVDDLAQVALGPVDAVEPLRVGSRVRRGEPLFRLHHGQRSLALPAPVSGTVVRTNPRLAADPELVNLRPYDAGWVAELRPDSLPDELRGLLAGRRARQWFQSEAGRLVALASPAPAVGALAQDGGTLVSDFHLLLDDRAWCEIVDTMFAGGR